MTWGEPARALEVRLLGPLEVTAAGRAVDLTASRPRALLAALALSAGRPVPAERLATMVWGEQLPDNVVRSVQTYVSRLRGLLGPGAIRRTTVGYQLRVEPDAVDALRFVRLLDAAAARAADPAGERELLGRALSLWRGTPLQGIRSEFLARSEAPRLVERYLAAIERRIDLDLADGRHGDLVAELVALTGRYPLREPLWVRLLEVLDRSGRQAEALDRFELVRRRLAEELGVDPGPELRRMHAALLAAATPGPVDETWAPPQPLGTGDAEPAGADLHRFYDLVDRARAVPDDGRAAALLCDAVLFWRKRLGAEPDGPVGADDGLRTDDLAALSATLEARARARPSDEPVLALLMLALYRQGRHADALERYERFRQRLADAGGEPAAALQRLHQQILVADLAHSPPLRPVPHQLPAPPTAFVGRAAELAALRRSRHSGAPVVVAVDGMAGVGKTAFAVHAAHGLADRYPDGELFLDLRGHSPTGCPVEASDALGRVLRALGIPGEQIPEETDDRAALYRSRLAGRRMLVLLDNAAAEAQVRPLLPGAAECLVLVTSRRRLVGLDATRTVSLGALPLPEAMALFARAAGDRVGAEAGESLREVVELCGRLPLAIRVAAARFTAHPTWTVGHLLDRLRAAHEAGLAELDAGGRGVAAALDLSYRQLAPDQARAYRLLGLHPGRDLDPYAAAALLDTTVGRARRLVDQLHDVHMLQESAPGRHLFHDLVGVHAAHRAAATDAEPQRRAALDRLLDHYAEAAAAATVTAYPRERPPGARTAASGRPIPPLRGLAPAVAWLDEQLPNLVAAARHAAEHDWHAHTLRLGRILHRHLATRGQYRDAELIHGRALAAARALADRPGEVEMLNRLGEIHRLQRRHELAGGDFTRALGLARASGDAAGEQEALMGLGDTARLLGRPGPAADAYDRVLAIARRRGDRTGELRTRYGLGWIDLVRGRLDPAVDHFAGALAIARATLDRPGEIDALVSLGHAHRMRGEHRAARDGLEGALTAARAIGHRSGELAALATLGHLYRSLDHAEQATAVFDRTLEIASEWGNRNWQFEALLGLGRLEHAAGRPEAALRRHRDALRLAEEMAQPVDEARSHDALAHAYRASGRDEAARRHWQRALEILTGLGVEQAEDEDTSVAAIRARLA